MEGLKATDNLRKLHDNLSKKDGFNVPYEQFEMDMQDTTNLKRLHENLMKKDGFNVPYENFQSDMFTTQSVEPAQTNGILPQNEVSPPVQDPNRVNIPSTTEPIDPYQQKYGMYGGGVDLSKKPQTKSGYNELGTEIGKRAQKSGWTFNQYLADTPDYVNRLLVEAYNISPVGQAVQGVGKIAESLGLTKTAENWKMKAADLRNTNATEYIDNQKKILTDEIAKINPKYEMDIIEAAKQGDWVTFNRNLAGGVADSFIPSLAMMLTGGSMGTAGMIGTGTALFGAGKYAEMDKAAPNMDEGTKVLASAANGALEGIFETFLGSGAVGSAIRKIVSTNGRKTAQEVLSKGIKQGFVDLLIKHPALAPLGEGFEEMGTQISQNYVDIVSGYKPDLKIMDGVLSSGVIGAFSGAVHSAPIYAAKAAFGGNQQQPEAEYQNFINKQIGIYEKTIKENTGEPDFSPDYYNQQINLLKNDPEAYFTNQLDYLNSEGDTPDAGLDKNNIPVFLDIAKRLKQQPAAPEVPLTPRQEFENTERQNIDKIKHSDGTVKSVKFEDKEWFVKDTDDNGELSSFLVYDLDENGNVQYTQNEQGEEVPLTRAISKKLIAGEPFVVDPEEMINTRLQQFDQQEQVKDEIKNTAIPFNGKLTKKVTEDEDGNTYYIEVDNDGNVIGQTEEFAPSEEYDKAIELFQAEQAKQQEKLSETPGQTETAPEKPKTRNIIQQDFNGTALDIAEDEGFDEVIPTAKMPLEKALPKLEKYFKDNKDNTDFELKVEKEEVETRTPGKTKYEKETVTKQLVIKSIKIVPKTSQVDTPAEVKKPAEAPKDNFVDFELQQKQKRKEIEDEIVKYGLVVKNYGGGTIAIEKDGQTIATATNTSNALKNAKQLRPELFNTPQNEKEQKGNGITGQVGAGDNVNGNDVPLPAGNVADGVVAVDEVGKEQVRNDVQQELEDKKADIERRRQEELNEYKNKDVLTVEEYQFTNEDGEITYVQIRHYPNGKRVSYQGLEKNKYGNVNDNSPFEISKEQKTEDYLSAAFPESTFGKWLKIEERTGAEAKLTPYSNKINAKYDKELADLENNPEINPEKLPETVNNLGQEAEKVPEIGQESVQSQNDNVSETEKSSQNVQPGVEGSEQELSTSELNDVEQIYDSRTPLKEDSDEALSNIQKLKPIEQRLDDLTKLRNEETDEEKIIELNIEINRLSEEHNVISRNIINSRQNIRDNMPIVIASKQALVTGRQIINKLKIDFKNIKGDINEWKDGMPISKQEFNDFNDAIKRLSVRQTEVTSNEELSKDIDIIKAIQSKIQSNENTEEKAGQTGQEELLDTVTDSKNPSNKKEEGLVSEKPQTQLEKLQQKLSDLEDKLYDVKVENNERLRNNPRAGAGYRSMVDNVTKKEDAIKKRIDNVKEQIKQLEETKSVPTPELTDEQKVAKINRLIDDAKYYDKIQSNHHKKKAAAGNDLQKLANSIGYSIGKDAKGKTTVFDENKKPVTRKIPVKRSQDEIQGHKALTDYSQDFQDLVNWFMEDINRFNQVKFYDSDRSQLQSAIKNIQSGTKTVAANNFLDDLERIFNKGEISFTDGFGAPLNEFQAMFIKEEDVLWETIFDDNISESELNDLFLQYENDNADDQGENEADGEPDSQQNGQEPIDGNEGNEPEVERQNRDKELRDKLKSQEKELSKAQSAYTNASTKHAKLADKLKSDEFGNRGQADIFGNNGAQRAGILDFGNANDEIAAARQAVSDAKKEVERLGQEVNRIAKSIEKTKDEIRNQQEIKFEEPVKKPEPVEAKPKPFLDERLEEIKNKNEKLKEAEKLHKGSYGLVPKNSLQRLLSAKQILDEINHPKESELYLENERLISNYKQQLGIEQPTPSVKPKEAWEMTREELLSDYWLYSKVDSYDKDTNTSTVKYELKDKSSENVIASSIEYQTERATKKDNDKIVEKLHKKLIQQAISEGREIPANVKAEYPELFEQKTQPKTYKIKKVGSFKFVDYDQTLLDESAALKESWRKELENGVSDKSRAIQQKLFDFNKKHFAVKIKKEQPTNLLGVEEGNPYGVIDFSDVSGYTDSSVFQTIENGKYIPNELGKKIKIRYSLGGGSALFNFDYTDENVELVKNALSKSGYNTVDLDKSLDKEKPVSKDKKEETPIWLKKPNQISGEFPDSKVQAVVFRGDKVKFAEFDESMIGNNDEGVFGKGIYFSEHKSTAGRYSNQDYANVTAFEVDIKKPYTININDTESVQKAKKLLSGKPIPQEYDGVIVYENGKMSEVVVRSKSQIKKVATDEDIWDAYDKGKYQQAINNGIITEEQAKEIVESSGIKYKSELQSPEKAEEQGDNQIRYMKRNPIGFYSTVENALTYIKQDKGTPEQFKAMLLKNGAKQAELEWMGWDDHFEGKLAKVTKADIQDWIEQNRIEVEEVQKGMIDKSKFKIEKSSIGWNVVDENGKILNSSYSEALAKNWLNNYITNEGDTKYSQYQEPGGENYREVLLTMPNKGREAKKGDAERLEILRNKRDELLSRGESIRDVDSQIQILSTRFSEGNGFRSSHFDEPNILAHIRFNERTDSEGNKVLFIEEWQADKGQEWQKLKKLIDSGKATQADIDRFNFLDKNFPFNKTNEWLSLAMRRMIRYAAENGFDRIAWTNGEQQADRYDLSKQINEVEVEKGSAKKSWVYKLTFRDKNDNPFIEYANTPNELEALVGKELTNKIISDVIESHSYKSYTGLDLKVGGEGMKTFYDAIVPGSASKLAKPFGAKLEPIEINFGNYINNETGDYIPDNRKTVQSIPITESMKESVLEGIPLFMDGTKPTTLTEKLTAAELKQHFLKFFEHARNTGNVHVVKNISEIPESVSRMVDVKDTAAFYDPKTKETWFVLDKIVNADEAFKAWVHEVGTHHGLRNIIPPAMFKPLMEKIYNDIGREAIQRVIPQAYWNEPINVQAEEYLAYLAPQVVSQADLTPQERSIWKQIVEAVKNVLNKLFSGARFTNNEAEEIIKAAVQSVYQRPSEQNKGKRFLDDILGMTDIWHGSPHAFDKFSTAFMGTGEGAQAYGWGLYFTDKEGIARKYATINDLYDNFPMIGDEVIDQQSDIDRHRILRLYEKFNGDKNKIANDIEQYAKVLELQSGWPRKIQAPIERELAARIRKEGIKLQKPRNIYKVKIHGDKTIEELNFLRWDKPVTKTQKESLKNIYEDFINKSDWKTASELSRKYGNFNFFDLTTGESIYKDIAALLGSDKSASLAMLEYGIDGIQYPSEYTTKGQHDNSFNYVVFDENAVEIDDHIRFAVVGERGAANLDRAEEATTRLDNLRVAKEMEASGKVKVILHKNSKPQDIELNPSKNQVAVYRTIYIDSISDIDFNEIGNHWTKSTVYKHLGKYNTNKKTAKIRAIFNKSDINNDATEVSNEGYPTESEIVINKNSNPVQLIVQFSNDENNFMYFADRHEVINANTGTRQDKWVDKLDGNHKTGKENITNKSFTPKQILLATGWQRGADGKWRYEVPDGKLKDGWDEMHDDDTPQTLSEVWDDPELFKAYPQLKDVYIGALSDQEEGMDGSYHQQGIDDKPTIYAGGDGVEQMTSTLLHEIQHAIQEIEGFARGGNTETHVPLVGENKAKIIKADSIWRGLGKSERSRIKGLFESNNISRIPQWNFVSITETEKIDDAIEQLEILNKEYPNQDIVDALNVLADLQDLTVGDAKYERYRRLAGEVESRNVQTRMNYTPEQRREILLEETEDVSRKDQIFIYDGLGASLENNVNLQDNITEYENNLYEAGQQYLPTKRNRPGTGSEIQEDYKGLENWTEEQFPKYASKIRSALNRHFNNNEYLSAEEVDDIAFGISELRKTGTQYLTQRDINAARALLERRGYYQMADNKSLTDSLKDHYYDLVKGKIRYNPIVEESIAEYNSGEPSILRMVATPKKGLGEAIENANIKYRQSKERKETFKEVVYQIRQNLQDNALPIRKFVENVKELGGTVKERMNVYNAYFRAFGRAEELHKQFTEQKWTPVVKAVAALQKSGVDGEYIVPYLIAKHGPERNLYMREQALQEWIQIEEQKKGAKPSDIEIEEKRAELSVKDYSGISGFDPEWKDNYDTMEEMAETITKDFESIADPQLVKDLHDALAVANKEVLDQWLAGRQITQKEYDDYKKRFKYFIPLRGWEDDAAKRFRYNKSSGFGRSLKHAQGRTSFAENPLANMQSVAFKAIGERVDNEVKESLLSLIVNNYETKFKSLYKIHKAYYRRGIDENGEVIYDVTKIKPTKEQLDSGEYTYEFHPQYMRLRTPANAMEHEVLVRKQGGDILIVFENNPEVAQAINHQNTMFKFHGEMVDAKSLNIVTKVFTWATNWIKAINTSYNPVFPLTNFARDIQEATAHIAISMGLDIGKDIPKLVPRAMKTAARRIYGKSTGTADDNLLQRFYELGAATGWTHGKSIEELQKELDNELKDLLRKGTIKGATKQAWNGLLNGIQSWNQIFEDTTRFAVFMAVREAEIKKGESVQDAELAAATAAKEASLNFNRKGRITKFLDAIWAFFNPSVQGMQKNFALARRYPKRFWGAAGSMMVFGFIEAMLNDMGDGDDDKYYDINEWSRRNYIVIRTGEKFVRIPLPQFWRGFHSMGVIAYDMLTSRTKAGKAAFDVTTNFIGGLSPIDIPGLFPNGEFNISPLAPSAVKPFIDLAYNKNYFQDQIYKEPYTKGVEKFKASSVMYDKNVNPVIKGVTEFLAKNVGGRYGESKSSMRLSWMGDFSPLDWNPSKIEYLIQQYTGGIGRIANDITKVAMAATMDEEDVKLNNIPFANSFVRTIPEGKWNVVNQYREYNNDNQEFSDELKEAKRLKDLNKLLELTADEKNKQIYGILNSTNKAMDKIIDAYGYEDEKWSDERIKMMNNAIAKIDSIEQEYKKMKQ